MEDRASLGPNPLRLRAVPAFDACEWRILPLQKGWPTYTLLHYPNNSAFDAFVGDDLTPYNHELFVNEQWHDNTRLRLDPALEERRCMLPEADGGTWHVQRVGPFTSTGSYDWWQMSGRDTAFLSEALSSQADGAIYMVESYLGPRDENMAPLPYPPVHVHHIHLLPKMETLRFHGEGVISRSYKQQLALERHGEWTRLGLGAINDKMANGMATELEPAGYGRRISFEMDMDAELNDARVANSAPIQWYIEFAIRWMPGNGPTKPVTLTNCINMQAPRWGAQSTYESYFFVEPHVPVVSWYTTTPSPTAQRTRVLYVKSHAHMNLLKRWYIFDGPASDLLGPDSFLARFHFSYPAERATELLDFKHSVFGVPPGLVMSNQWPLANTSYRSWDTLEAALLAGTGGDKLLCKFMPNHYKTANAWYDRAVNASCREWMVEPGKPFTSVAFLHYDCVPGGAAGVCPVEPWLGSQLPPHGFPMHTELFIVGEVIGDDPSSCYVTNLPLAFPDAAGNVVDLTWNRGQKCAVGASGKDPTVDAEVFAPSILSLLSHAQAATHALYRIRTGVAHTLMAPRAAESSTWNDEDPSKSNSLWLFLPVPMLLVGGVLARRHARRYGYEKPPIQYV